jgi:DNA-binding NtrC family response regulator
MMVQGDVIDVSDLPDALQSGRVTSDNTQQGLLKLHEVVYQHAQSTIEHCGGNRARAAEMMGIGRATLYRLLAKNGQ